MLAHAKIACCDIHVLLKAVRILGRLCMCCRRRSCCCMGVLYTRQARSRHGARRAMPRRTGWSSRSREVAMPLPIPNSSSSLGLPLRLSAVALVISGPALAPLSCSPCQPPRVTSVPLLSMPFPECPCLVPPCLACLPAGISITSTAMVFETEGRQVTLLDTPGHQVCVPPPSYPQATRDFWSLPL